MQGVSVTENNDNIRIKISIQFQRVGGGIFVWIQDHGSCDHSFISLLNKYLFGSRGFLLVIFTCSYYMVPFNFYSYLSFARNYECVVVPSLRNPGENLLVACTPWLTYIYWSIYSTNNTCPQHSEFILKFYQRNIV